MALAPYVLPVEAGSDGKLRARKNQHETAINNALEGIVAIIDENVTELRAEITAAAHGAYAAPTWTALTAIVGTRLGQRAEVPISDTGTHTDPVVGGTVPNSGKFAWSTSPAGWRRYDNAVDTTAVTTAISLTQIGIQDGTVSFAGSTATVSWSQARATFNGTVYTIAALPATELVSNETLYLDMVAGPPYTAVKAVTSPSLRSDFAKGTKLQLLYNTVGTLMGPMKDVLLHNARARIIVLEDKVNWEPSDLVLQIFSGGNGQFDVYQKASPQNSTAYTRFRVRRNLVGDEAGVGRASDVWRLDGIYSYLRTGRWTFDYVRRLCNEGEHETAIKINGASDYMGGRAHGDEKHTRVYLRADGRTVTLTPGADILLRCRTVEMIQATTLYLPDTTPAANTPVATVIRRHLWKDGEFRLYNFVTFSAVLNLDQTFLTMLPVEREDYQNPGYLITNNAQRSPLFLSETVDVPDFPMTQTNASLYKLSGPNGFGFEVEMLKGWDKPNRRSWVANAAAYNKVYFDVFGPGYLTAIGETIETESRYRFMAL